MKEKVLIIIPARGGSKGIPRKNLRTLHGKPLIHYSISTALKSAFKPCVYVSTDDEEIAAVSRRLGAGVVVREAKYAEDSTTLDPVIHQAYTKVREELRQDFDIVVTLQPTSPLLKTSTLDAALSKILSRPDVDTIISAKEDTHLSWSKVGEGFVPNYKARVNRQYLPPVYRETGGFLITRGSLVTAQGRIGKQVDLYPLEGAESIDIDTHEDWNLCEFYLTRRKLLFVVSGYKEIGLGHVYNALLIANHILDHHVEFLVDDKSQLAFDRIASKNYRVRMQKHVDIVDDIAEIAPDVVINDRLDSSAEYVAALKRLGCRVINFEDLGEGARLADLVVNAIYPEKEVLPNHYFGHRYFLLRDEFLLAHPGAERPPGVRNVLLTFGGVDPNNYTRKVLSAIHAYCQQEGIQLSVVAGFGYKNYEGLQEFAGVEIFKDSLSISDHMRKADLIFTSAGRTAYEIASVGVPAIVLAQNERELTHFFASSEYGFLNLGLGYELSGESILDAFRKLVENPSSRTHMQKLMREADLAGGGKRVLKLIYDVLDLT